VYVRGLIRELATSGWDSAVAVPAETCGSEVLDGVEVHRIQVADVISQPMIYGDGDPVSARGFAEVLEVVKPDLVHFHAFSPAISVLWLDAARERGLACVYTYHTPTLACVRGTLMRWGTTICDGEMRPLRCAACALHGLGVSQFMAWGLALASPITQGTSGRVPFRAWPLMRRRTSAARRWLEGQSRVIALCRWGESVMRRNGVSADQLRVVRHGLAVASSGQAEDEQHPAADDVVKVCFLGRLDETKGLHVLAAALDHLKDVRFELHCHLVMGEALKPVLQAVLDKLKADARVFVHAPVPPDQVVAVMRRYDAVAVPSVWLETGPLVVLEAFAAGVPVLGSDLGGISEWVTHERDGLLVAPGDPAAWAAVLRLYAREPALRARLRAGVRPPPTMADVAVRMDEIYREVLN
jgi:glycosyltransferase involved in cell wall biosynthesis